MTDQERSAAREAFLLQWAVFGYKWPAAPNEAEIAAMHAVLTKHEADVRRRIADKIGAITCYNLQSEGLQRRILAIVNPPEPPKPVKCEGCGHTETAHVSVMLNGERVLLCSDAKFAPAEESTR